MSRMPTSSANAVNGSQIPSIAPSNTSLLLTNLRLLDLDKLPDWPSITVHTFSTKDAGQNQKQRIRCVEWTLFRLFELWGPEETREKLQPFFPPLEPLQSLNLRAALYRALNELKKNGLLGRETTLRKTMLDDCAGPKLLEVLAVFSTNIVKAFLEDGKRQDNISIAQRLATAQALDSKSTRSMLPLAIGHRASLKALLRRKSALKDQYRSLADNLSNSVYDLQTRELAAQKFNRDKTPPDLELVSAQVRESWVGNANWADTIIHGEASTGDQLLGNNFSDIWRTVSRGQALEPVNADESLQARLEKRVQQQRRRVGQWQAFHSSLKSSGNSAGETIAETQSLFHFNAHRAVKIGRGQDDDETRPRFHTSLDAQHAYGEILHTMKDQLASVSTRAPKPGGGDRANHMERRVTSPRTRLSASFGVLATPPSQRTNLAHIHAVQTFASGEDHDESIRNSPVTPQTPSMRADSRLRHGSLSQHSDHHIANGSPKTPGQVELPESPMPSRTMATPVATQEEDLAAQIVASIPDETPMQPAANNLRRLTLAERTRLSMAPGSHQQPRSLLSTSDEADASRDLVQTEQVNKTSGLDRRASLLDRTRQSMSVSVLPTGNDVKQHKSRKSIAGKQVKRTSLYPINQFETPGRAASLTLAEMSGEDDSQRTTPRDTLFSDDAEYNSVFRSRPKIALSPVNTPDEDTRIGGLDGVVDTEGSFPSSPLGRLG